MARIGFLMTRTPWYDQRQYHRQGPALLAEGHTVVYLAGIPPDIDLDYPYEPVPLSAAERKAAARTGGLNLLRKIARARLDLLQICSVELLPLGIVAKLLRMTKVVYDCREDMPSAMRDHKPQLSETGAHRPQLDDPVAGRDRRPRVRRPRDRGPGDSGPPPPYGRRS